MKQSEILDLILKELYETKSDGQFKHIRDILNELNIHATVNEVIIYAERLKIDGFAEIIKVMPGGAVARITSFGIDYVENDSYSYRGKSIITNNYIFDSPNASIVNQSQNVSIKINNNEVNELFKQLQALIESSNQNDEKIKTAINDCLYEFKESVEQQKPSKSLLRQLLSLTSDIGGAGTLIYTIAKALGLPI